jgi:DnaK suppressor protein
MTKEEKAKLKENITEKIVQFKAQIIELKEITKPIAPDCAIGRVSRMDAINNRSVNEAALRQKQAQLKALEYALENINEERFGICIACGQSIPMWRILIMPGSKKCVNCASR